MKLKKNYNKNCLSLVVSAIHYIFKFCIFLAKYLTYHTFSRLNLIQFERLHFDFDYKYIYFVYFISEATLKELSFFFHFNLKLFYFTFRPLISRLLFPFRCKYSVVLKHQEIFSNLFLWSQSYVNLSDPRFSPQFLSI